MNGDEWEEISNRFREDGIDPSELSDGQKLLRVWGWLVDAETNAISLRHQLDKLSRRQDDQVQEIRNCMQQMCSAWEMKVSKLEEENQCFQEQLGFNSERPVVSQEINQMLISEGLPHVADLTVVEQFAFLLDERITMQRQLEQEVLMRRKCEQLMRTSSNLPDCLKLSSPYIQRILDKQKDEYEEEIRHQQETMKHVKEQLKQVHEDELHRLSSENETLHSDLSNLSQKLQELVTHVSKQQEKNASQLPWVQHILDGTHNKEMENCKLEMNKLMSLCQDQQKQIRDQCETLRIRERTNKQLEIDNETLAFKLSESLAQFDELEDQLRREATHIRRESFFKQFTAKESSIKNNMNNYLDNRPGTQDSVFNDQIKQLKEESTTLKEQLESVQQQLEVMSLKYQQHKEKSKEKMFRLRDLQDQEHREWQERFDGCEKELSAMRTMLAREKEWRAQMETDCQKLKILENKQVGQEIAPLNSSPCHRDVEKLKVSTTHSPVHSGSPRKHTVWPVTNYASKW